MKLSKKQVVLAILGGCSAPLLAHADGVSQYLQDRTHIQLGGFRPNIDSGISIHGSNGRIGDDLDMESDLGMSDSKTSPWLGLSYRFADKHRVGLSYFGLNRSAGTTLQRDFNLGDQTYTAGLDSNSTLDINVTVLDYQYLFSRSDRHEAHVSFGLHRVGVETSVEAAASIGNSNGAGGSRSMETTARSVYAPLPVLGVGGIYALGDNWAVKGGLRYFGLDIDNIDGSLVAADVSLQYHPWRHVGLTLGYAFDRLDFDLEKEKWSGSARYDFKGVTFGLIGHF